MVRTASDTGRSDYPGAHGDDVQPSSWREDPAFIADVEMGIALGMPVLDLDRSVWMDHGH